MWEDIHRASLHQLIRTSIQYYIHLHHTRIQDLDTLLTELVTNSEFGDLTRYINYGEPGLIVPATPPRQWEPPTPEQTANYIDIPTNIPPPTNPGI
jgi:hypothetical protein